jgi:two-component system OmpR family response regulator
MIVALHGGVTDLEGRETPTVRPAPGALREPDRLVRMAIFEPSGLNRSVLIRMASEIGWAGEAFDRFDDLTAVIAAGHAELMVFSLADVPVPRDELGALLAAVDVPIVALVDDLAEQKRALRVGASLAITKPLDPELLALSIQALLRRGRALTSVLSETATVSDLTVQVANHTIERGGRRQVLSPTEWQLFAFLLAHPGRTFSRDQLVEGAWEIDCGGRRAQIDLYVYRLRRKVERDPRHPEIIKTVRHHGYRLNTVAARSAVMTGQPA